MYTWDNNFLFLTLFCMWTGLGDKRSKRDGTGWAINHSGNSGGGGTYGLASSTLHAKAKACLHALQWCIKKGRDDVLLLSYPATLINNLSKSMVDDIPIWWTNRDIKDLASKCKIM